jgi:XTP/dITP diphosphohydrolase
MQSSTSADRWVIATANAGKLAEFELLLRPFAVAAVGQGELGIDAVAETGQTFLENALLKARHAAGSSGLPALADDSGLCVDALAGEPGLRSARFAGADATASHNVALLLDRLRDVPLGARAAHFVCVIVAVRSAADPDPLVASGRWYGQITTAPRGARGFGYDPVFEVPDLGLTAAELDPARKHSLSHRGAALQQLLAIWPRSTAAPA